MKAKPDTSDEAVKKATGRTWSEWVKFLSDAGAASWSHKETAVWLGKETGISSWWCQQVAVGFEKLTGKRVLGETADAGFQIGVRRTYPFSADDLWRKLTAKDATELWLGTGDAKLAQGEPYDAGKVAGEIRVLKPGDRVRFTRASKGSAPSTVQIALSASGPGKTSVTFHHEKLGGAEEREAMRDHWKKVADRLQALWLKG